MWVDDVNAAALTDLYELTMVQAYWAEGMHDDAVFSLFVRRLPEARNYLVACGLDDVLHYLETLRFDEASIAYLGTLGTFQPGFLDWLSELRFTGDVYAVREGTPVFADEPILEIVAPMPEAQLVETFVMNQVHHQTTIASKAARGGRARPNCDRLRSAPHARHRRRTQGRARVLRGWRGRHQQRTRGCALRHPGARHNGPFVRPGAR
jgi:putative nicotinate phosphoribosyltransferase